MSSAGKPPKPSVASQARVFSAFVAAFGKALLGGKPHHKLVTAQLQDVPEGTSRLWAKNARLILEEGIALLIDELQAELQVLDPLSPLIPEKPEGYSFQIQRGRMAMDAGSIAALMNRYAFPRGTKAPLTDIRITLDEGVLGLKASFHLNSFLPPVPLSMRATADVTPEGLIALTPTGIRAGALPVDRLMSMLGVELGRFMPEGASAMTFSGDRILVNPVGMFPAPKASGHLVGVAITGEHLVMSYEDGSPVLDPPLMEPDASSYIAMLGHDLLVGKITMVDVCLQMIPLDPLAESVELAIPHYRLQLAQGESSLKYADELLYKLPAVAALKSAPLPPPRSGLPSLPPQT